MSYSNRAGTVRYFLYLGVVGAVCVGLYSVVSLNRGVGTCSEDVRNQPYIAIVSAFSLEEDVLHGYITPQETCEIDGIPYHIGTVDSRPILMFASGIGPSTAQKTMESTLAHFRVTMVLVSGVAGGVDPTLDIGQTVVAQTWLNTETGHMVTTDAQLLEKVRLLEGVKVVRMGATVPSFVSDPTNLPKGTDVVDMETAAIAMVAEAHSIPFLAFRSISDFSDGTGTDEGFERAAIASAEATFQYLQEGY